MFGGSGGVDLNQLLAKKNYRKAIDVLREQLAVRKSDPRLRMQLADVLTLAGGGKEAVSVLLPLADEYAREGFAAKAIAVLKKVEKIDPGRRDVEKQLANLIKQGKPEPRRALPLIPPGGAMEIGMEEIGIGIDPITAPAAPAAPAVPDFESEFAPPEAAEPAPKARPVTEAALERFAREQAAQAAAAAKAPAPPAADDSALDGLEDIAVPMSEEDFRAGVLDALGDALAASKEDAAKEAAAEAAEEAAAISEGTAPKAGPVASPLFEEFTQDELVEVIHGLQLVTFAPGDIIITEGEPGSSLFVLTSGSAKAFVRSQAGKNTMVRELHEGDFFGEISILSGKPRTATVTAGTECDLLELDRATLDAIAQTKPRVWDVLKDFAALRSGSARDKRLREQK
jgi:cAMP-dependent protein kinase regulator